MAQQGRIENEEWHRAYTELQKISSAVHEEARQQLQQLQASETRSNAMPEEGQIVYNKTNNFAKNWPTKKQHIKPWLVVYGPRATVR